MMILSDGDIRKRLQKGDLVVEPLDDPDQQIQPSSIDLRLGHEFVTYQTTHVPYIDPEDAGTQNEYTNRVEIDEGERFILHPGEFALASTLERIELPPDLVAFVEGRSSLGRLAIVVHATAGLCDPGFEGRITLELSNLGKVPVALHPQMRISQIVIHEMKNAAEVPYGAERGSKYQGQQRPELTRIEEDFGDEG
jgi:dCTP deaminase